MLTTFYCRGCNLYFEKSTFYTQAICPLCGCIVYTIINRQPTEDVCTKDSCNIKEKEDTDESFN